jgi:hypothetical protein
MQTEQQNTYTSATKKKNTLPIAICLIVLGVALIGYAIFGTTNSTSLNKKTYFKYSSEELNKIRSAKAANAENLDLNDTNAAMIEEIITNNSLPTYASKYYAYMLTSQNDARLLSPDKNTENSAINETNNNVSCIFFPDRCKEPDSDRTTKGEVVADIVTQKVWDRINQDKLVTAEAMKTMEPGDDIWYELDTVTPDAKAWKTWFIESPDQFRASAPPTNGSDSDKQQIEAVKTALKNLTEEQREKVKYWAAAANSPTPSGLWLKITNEYMNSKKVPQEKQMEIRANLAMMMADALISCWDTKFTYWTRRPFMRDKGITPIIQTPNFPSYVSGHSAVSASAATLLSYYFPEDTEKWQTMATEAKNSRLWAGIHFPVDNEEGYKMGISIGNYTIEKLKNK